MALRTAAEFLAGLRDAREVYYRGQRVPSVVDHPELGVAARHASIDFEMAENPKFRELAVHREGSDEYSAYYRVPRNSQDLLSRSKLIEAGTAEGATLVLLIKEIGTDALFALKRVLGRSGDAQGIQRVEAFYRHCRDKDLAMAVAQTDVKGDRSKRPSEQSDPDMYVRVVEKRADGIVVSGAKIHTSCTPYVDEVIVLPSRSMGPGDEPWSLAFAVPVATPGLRLYASDYLHGTDDPFTRPISTNHKMVETLTVFENVFVPWDRVFYVDRPDLAGATALTFVEFHRFTAVSYKLPLLDALVGAGIVMAKANGIDRAGHVRDKLTWLGGYAETVRGLTELAALRCKMENGVAYPDVFTTNMAKWTFAREFHQAIETVQDLAGGLARHRAGRHGLEFTRSQACPGKISARRVARGPADGHHESDQRFDDAPLWRISGGPCGACRGFDRSREIGDVPGLRSVAVHRAGDAARGTGSQSRLAK